MNHSIIVLLAACGLFALGWSNDRTSESRTPPAWTERRGPALAMVGGSRKLRANQVAAAVLDPRPSEPRTIPSMHPFESGDVDRAAAAELRRLGRLVGQEVHRVAEEWRTHIR